jgi:hypothetical protein
MVVVAVSFNYKQVHAFPQKTVADNVHKIHIRVTTKEKLFLKLTLQKNTVIHHSAEM